MAKAADTKNAEFLRGWNAALHAVRAWHEAKAKQAIVQSTRTRFPKNLEREAEVHKRAAELVVTLSPDDV
jgi:hypothetical protein